MPLQYVFLLPHIPWIEQGEVVLLLVTLLYGLCDDLTIITHESSQWIKGVWIKLNAFQRMKTWNLSRSEEMALSLTFKRPFIKASAHSNRKFSLRKYLFVKHNISWNKCWPKLQATFCVHFALFLTFPFFIIQWHIIIKIKLRTKWIRLRLPFCRPGFESEAHHLCFHEFIELCNGGRTKINKKRPRMAHLNKKEITK